MNFADIFRDVVHLYSNVGFCLKDAMDKQRKCHPIHNDSSCVIFDNNFIRSNDKIYIRNKKGDTNIFQLLLYYKIATLLPVTPQNKANEKYNYSQLDLNYRNINSPSRFQFWRRHYSSITSSTQTRLDELWGAFICAF